MRKPIFYITHGINPSNSSEKESDRKLKLVLSRIKFVQTTIPRKKYAAAKKKGGGGVNRNGGFFSEGSVVKLF